MAFMSSKSRFLAVFLVAAALFAGWWFIFASNPEQKINRTIMAGKKAIEAEDLEGTIEHVSKEYEDERGLSYLIVKRLLRDAFAQFDQFEVEMEDPKIELVKGERKGAWARFDLRLFVELEGRRGILVGSMDEPAHLEIFLVQKPWGWLVEEVRGFRTPLDDF